ncbi:MAG TPA: hypothetical protein VG758_31775 [Hyphomicrobiaceae bacterium]|nr:hypothetical protein [Hyphomicrobiaceae bacterium]
MLAHTSRAPGEVVGRMQATANRGEWELTVEKVAVNAVMAGARPDYFPVILALAASNISARSSSSASAMVVVNGPIRSEIGMNCGVGALGPYNHANATIGRAYGFLSQNGQGGSVVGETYMGSLGNGYTYNNLTFAENEERSPWTPLHVQKGFSKEESTVIFWGCRSTTFARDLRRGADGIQAQGRAGGAHSHVRHPQHQRGRGRRRGERVLADHGRHLPHHGLHRHLALAHFSTRCGSHLVWPLRDCSKISVRIARDLHRRHPGAESARKGTSGTRPGPMHFQTSSRSSCWRHAGRA